MDNDEKTKLINLELKAKEKTLSLIPGIEKIIKKFDGKVSSKRLDTALKKLDDNLSFRTEFNSWIIKYYIRERNIKIKDGSWSYIRNSDISIVHSAIESGYGDAIEPDGVIIADTVISHLKEYEKYSLACILATKKDLKNIKVVLSNKEKLKNKIEEFNNSYGYLVGQYFELRL